MDNIKDIQNVLNRLKSNIRDIEANKYKIELKDNDLEALVEALKDPESSRQAFEILKDKFNLKEEEIIEKYKKNTIQNIKNNILKGVK